jgi:HlyB family type I secretion system ABC transporter
MTPLTAKVVEESAFFRFLPPALRDRVASNLREATYGFGDVIVREGDPGDAFFIITSGHARVVKTSEGGEEISLGVLRTGEDFGEMALVSGEARSATVRCSSEVTVLRLDRQDFQRLIDELPDLRAAMALRVRHRALQGFLRQFSELGRLPFPVQRALVERLTPMVAAAGETIVHEGHPAGPMYVIESGRARVYRAGDGRLRSLAFLRAGDYFGELSVLRGSPRTASVDALTECRLLALAPEDLSALARDYPEFRRVLDERAAQYNAKVEARIPLDFAREMLPADVAAYDKVPVDRREERPDAQGVAEAAEEEDFAPFATPEGHFRKRRRRIRRFPFVQQIDEMDCGAASLGMVCRHFGRRVSLTRIRQLAHTAYDGTSLRALCHAATELGLAARGIKVSRRNLDRMPLPSIVHWEGNHWIVLVHVGRRVVRVADPALGMRTLSRDEFDRKWSGYAALFDYTDSFAHAPEGRSSIGWVLPFLAPFKGILARVLLLSIVASLLQMLIPIFTQVVVDRVVVERDLGLLNVVSIGMLVALLFILTGGLLERFMLSYAAVRVDASILDFLTRRLLALPMSYFSARRTGDIQRRLQGARQVREFVVHDGIGGLLAVVQIVVAVGTMAAYSPTLAAVFLAVSPAYAGLMAFSTRVLRPLFARLEESHGKYSSFQIDAIRGIETMKATAAEQTFRSAMLNQFVGVADQQFRANFIIMAYDAAVQAVGLVAAALFLWVGARMVIAGGLTIGGFVAFNALMGLAYAPIVRVLTLWDDWQVSAVLLNRLGDIFDSEPEQGHDRSRLHPVPTLGGLVELRGLGFRYGGADSPPILSGINLEIPAGRMTAIVGRSGSGKSTLVKCLSGLLEPTDGAILFDGLDMRTLNYRDLRRKIGVVLQENYLFNETILRNIAFGDPEPDMERALWAARAADAHDFILRLPLRYETRIGESGLALSGGQRQRIAIARALYADPAILIFDEATSALDSESEQAVQQNMEQLLGGRTSIVIAHRLSTVRSADSIVVLEKGQVAERGTHAELMARRGLYFYLCSQQLGL